MRNLLLLLLLAYSFSGSSQRDIGRVTGYSFYSYDEFATSAKPNEAEEIRSQKISSKTITRYEGKFNSTEIFKYNEKGQKISREYSNSKGWNSLEKYTYNEQGVLIKRERRNSKNELVSSYNYYYNDQNLLIRLIYKNTKKTHTYDYRYDENKNRTSEISYDTKGHFSMTRKEFEPESNRLILHEIYKKDSVIPVKHLVYSYHENGSKKAIHYFQKNKLEYTWTFDCKEEGELVSLKKSDSTFICFKTETDTNGNEIRWLHEFSSVGKPVKIKSVFSADGILLETTHYRADGSLQSIKTHVENGGSVSKSYNEKGDLIYTVESRYNSDQKPVKYTRCDEKNCSSIWYSYLNNLPVLITIQGNKKTTIEEIEYTFFE
jgi:hypothetical protein